MLNTKLKIQQIQVLDHTTSFSTFLLQPMSERNGDNTAIDRGSVLSKQSSFHNRQCNQSGSCLYHQPLVSISDS
jgi:hypothetical protein